MTPTFDELWSTVSPLTLLHRYKAKLVYDSLWNATPGGDAVECGVFRGGTVVLMAKVLGPQDRRVRAYDSFQGLPDDRSPVETEHYRPGHMIHSEEALRNTLREHGVSDVVDVVSGWFADTMKNKYPRPLSFAHVDCDMYNGAKTCIEHLYDALLPGGIVVFDDYFDQGGGVQAAVDEMIARTGDVLRAGYTDQVFVVKGKKRAWHSTQFPWPKNYEYHKTSSGWIDISIPVGDYDYQHDLVAGKLTGELPGGTLANARTVAERILAQCSLHDAVIRKSSRKERS